MKGALRCRLCLKNRGTLSVFSLNEDLKICDMLGYCCSITVLKNDGLPESICNKCVVTLRMCFQFKITCMESDYELRKKDFINLYDCATIIDKLKRGVLYITTETQTDLFDKKINTSDQVNVKDETTSLYNEVLVKNESNELKESSKMIVLGTLRKSKRISSKKKATNTKVIHKSVEYTVDDSNDMDTSLVEFLLDDNEQSKISDDEKETISCGDKGAFVKKKFTSISNGSYDREEAISNKIKLVTPKLAGVKRLKRRLTKYVCEKCGYAANDKTSLRVHYRSHTGERPYACTICDKSFAVGENLKAHMRRHTGEKPFVCHTCGKAFAAMSSLRGHMRTHSGERPYACEACGRRFALRSNMLQHSRTHTNDRPHTCKICRSCFITRSDLSVHTRTHNSEKLHACHICLRRFALASTLAAHSRLHTGQRDHVCSHCGRGYISKSSLVVHIKIHHSSNNSSEKTSEVCSKGIPLKPYVCLHCSKGFMKKSSLKMHMKKHKPDAGDWNEDQNDTPVEQQSQIHLSIAPATEQNLTRQLLGTTQLIGEQHSVGQLQIRHGRVVSVMQTLPGVSVATVLPITVVPVSIVTR